MKTHNKTSVLLVEDDVDLRNTISENLTAVDYKVYAAKKSVEGLDFFKKYDIDVCVLDIEMTGIDGFALAAQIKILNPDVPMIFLTSKGLLVNILKDFEYGVDDYLTKPFTNEELLLRIKAVMRRVEKKDPFTYTLSGDRINIGRFVLALHIPQHQLRSGIIYLSDKSSRSSQMFVCCRQSIDLLAYSEINKFDLTVKGNHHITWIYIPVNETFVMQCHDSGKD